MNRKVIVCLLFFFILAYGRAQDTLVVRAQDTIPINAPDSLVIRDSIIAQSITQGPMDSVPMREKHSPRKAAIRSAIIPGWGQVYNKKIWKVPIVYAAIGIPVGTFFYNRSWYIKTRDAAKMLGGAPPDTANYMNRVDPQLYVFFSTPNSLGALLNYRNEFRRNMDYSILITLAFWGLNVVDATVDAHLKDFDVSDDLSLRIRPTLLNYNMTPGVSFVFTIGQQGNRRERLLY